MSSDLENEAVKSRKKDQAAQCKACGMISLPGVNTSISIMSHRSRPPKKLVKRGSSVTRTKIKSPRFVVRKCLTCHRFTKDLLGGSEDSVKARKSLLQTGNTTPETVQNLSITSTKNASSKERAKARKGGLQAMLAKSKSTTKPVASGLDLMDFMQTGRIAGVSVSSSGIYRLGALQLSNAPYHLGSPPLN